MRKYFVLIMAFALLFLLGCDLELDSPLVSPSEYATATPDVSSPVASVAPTTTTPDAQTPGNTLPSSGSVTTPSAGSNTARPTATPTAKPTSGGTTKKPTPTSGNTGNTAKPTNTPSDQTPKPEYPVVIVPGILATELVCEDKVVWPFFDMDMDPSSVDKSQLFPLITEIFGNLNKLKFTSEGVSANRVLPRRYSPVGSILEDRTYKIGVDDTYYDLAKALSDVVGSDKVFFFGYDWRMDIQYIGHALDSYIDSVCQKTGSDKVNIIAHSMGGLVTSSYLSQTKTVKASTVITLGSPFLGSDMATELLYEKDFDRIVRSHVLPILGYGQQPRSDSSSKDKIIEVAVNAMYDVSITLPSIYGLVPGESQALFEQPLSTAASMGFATSKALCAGYAKAFSKVDHYNVIGIGSDSVQFNVSGSNYEKVMVDGDGTVTKNSACAGDLFTSNLIELRLTHVELVTDSGSINTIIDLMY